MANHLATKKNIRKIETRTLRNKARLSATRTAVKKVEEAIKTGDKNTAQERIKAMASHLMRAAKRGLYHKNTVARRLSRFSKRIKAL